MNQLTALSTLAVEIDALNEQANIFANQAVIYAAKSGQKLLLAKAQCNHGEFKSWLDENCKIPYSMAKKYMQLAANRTELLDDSKGRLNALLPSVTQMIELLSADENVNEVVVAKIEAGEDVTIKEIKRLKKEAADLLAEKQAIQSDLLSVKKSAENYQTMYSESSRQRDELRDNQAQIINAKVSEEQAKLILENSNALQNAQKLIDDAQDTIERLQQESADQLERFKKEKDKAIKDGVSRELNTLQTEIDQKRYQIEQHEKDIESFKKTKSELNAEVGALAIHKKSIKDVKENLTFLAACFTDAFDTACIPVEVMNDWQAIHYAVSQIKRQIGSWLDQKSIESSAIISDLVDLETILENAEEAHA
ncbi:MAG: DUF3102 domain-containing protein [Methylococcales bacterium]|nr:DUF3102 domain-containing protein [Methylococcales bacterium]